MSSLTLMNSITVHVPTLVSHAGERAGMRFVEFFTANMPPRAPRSYTTGAGMTSAWMKWREYSFLG